MDLNNPTDLIIVKGILRTVTKLQDKALLLEKQIGLESIYAVISMGQSLAALSSSLGITMFEMEYMLKRTPDHRKQYLNAKTLAITEGSLKVLNNYSGATQFDKEDAAAMKHHSGMLDKSLKIVNADNGDEGTGNIVVNNTVVVSSTDDVPQLPDELKDVIEGEIINVDIES